MLNLKFKKVSADSIIPRFVRENDAAFDIYSNEEVSLKSGESKTVSTGVSSEIPSGYYVSFEGRSGLAAINGIDVLGGIIDSEYRGEWKVILVNLGKDETTLEKGERIAQGILHKMIEFQISETDVLSETKRGDQGFGSSGKK